MTEPPIQVKFSDQVSLYTIHLAYMENEMDKTKTVKKPKNVFTLQKIRHFLTSFY